MSDSVAYAVTNGVATITLNRPDAMNALDTPTKVLLRDSVLAAAEDEAVRVVVLTGTGRAFCVGQDLKEHIGLLEANDTAALWSTVPDHFAPIALALAEMPKPVIAAVNGVAAGPTVAYGAVRQSLRYSATHTLADSLVFEAGKMELTGDTEDHRNAVTSFVAKQKPTFTGR
jgi:enoyl-CoA hydratase/carnithine racemase